MKKIKCMMLGICASLAGLAQTDSVNIISYQTTSVSNNNTEVYRVNNALDIPLTAVGTGYTLYGFSKIYGRDKTPESVILALNPNNINSLDRRIADNYSQSAKDLSDKFFYGSMPAPLILLLDKEIRKDAAKVGLLYLQAMATTGSLYVSSSMIADRFRPYTYNPDVEMSRRTSGGGKNSFFAGHPALVATSTFFMAKVYSDYHPQMRNKWILFTLAGGATAATGLLRLQAGEHFITDVMVGVPVGVLSGILIPHFHKNKTRDSRLTVLPVYNQGGHAGVYASWKLK